MGQRRRALTPERSTLHLWGSELRAWRDRRRLSLAGLGDAIRYDPSYLGRLERAEQFPPEHLAPYPAPARSPAAPARASSQLPVTASKAAASAPVTTRQIVDFNGGPARAGRPRTAGTALPAHQRAHQRPSRRSR